MSSNTFWTEMMKQPRFCEKANVKSYSLDFILIAFCMIAGLAVRFWPLWPWDLWQASHTVGGQFIPASQDSYYFARYAAEYTVDTYGKTETDTLRNFPDGLPYPNSIPLLSWMTSLLSQWAGLSLSAVMVFMPPILAVLVVLPIWAYRSYLPSRLIVFGGALLGVSSYAYVLRTAVGQFDTDCLNVFFLVLAGYLIQRAAEQIRWVGVLWACIAALCLIFFNWWYNHPELLLLYLGVFLVLLVVNRERDIWYFYLAKLSVLGSVLFVANLQVFLVNISKSFNKYLIPTASESGFPSVIKSVGEAQHLGLGELFDYTGYTMFGPLAVAGVIGLAWCARFSLLGLLPVLLLSSIAFVGASRFAIYLAPILGLGLGYWAWLGVRLVDRYAVSRAVNNVARGLITVLLVIACFDVSSSFIALPPQPDPATYRGLQYLADKEPEGAVWAWWDWGYAIQDVTGNPTYSDGGYAAKAFFAGLTLAHKDPEAAYNIISGVTHLGLSGIEQEIALRGWQTPAPIVEALREGRHNEALPTPVYLVLTGDLLEKFHWPYHFGTWDFATGASANRGGYILLQGPLERRGDFLHTGNAQIDLQKGRLHAEGRYFNLRAIRLVDYTQDQHEPDNGVLSRYPHTKQDDVILQVVRWMGGEQLMLLQQNTFETLFHQMFVLNLYDPEYFELVYSDYPAIKIFRLLPEK